jgi:sugar (glycoside-pentoside-hexuronide) transporter
MNKTTLTTKISYAASDAAGQLIFCAISFYLLKFYTDVVGLSAAVAGNILLIARLMDAIDAPIWGMIFDKTKSRYGKNRPWFLWLCFPFALFGVLTFTSPDLGTTAKALYCGGIYIICSILYTGINTPVTSILSALTPSSNERVLLTCYRMFGSKAGVLVVNALAWPLVAFLGQGNDSKGFLLTMSIFAVGSILLYLLAFRNLKEIVPQEKKSIPIKQSFGALRGNWPWFIIFASCFFFWIAFISRISTVPYYFEYVWHRKDLVPLVNSLDVISLVGIFLIPWFCKRFSKGSIWAVALIGAVLSQFLIHLGGSWQSLPVLMVGWVAGILTSGVALALPFSLLSDSVDYGEWKSGIRAAGLLTAIGASFCLKAGSGLGGALPAWMLSAYGYVPNVEQSATAITGIEMGFIWLPMLFYALAAIPVFFYGRFEKMEPEIQAQLSIRREQNSLA